jgi:hypothetical protein
VSVRITAPTSEQIATWWRWGAGLSDEDGPFRKDLGDKFDSIPQPQPDRFICLSCTAGNGGVDTTKRPLRGAMLKGVPVLVPVFIGCGYVKISEQTTDGSAGLTNEARREVGTIDFNGNPSAPVVVLNIDDDPYSAFYVEQDLDSVTFVRGNSFGLPEGKYYLATAGYWAVISPPFRKIIFGGKGGRISPTNSMAFETQVTFELPDK